MSILNPILSFQEYEWLLQAQKKGTASLLLSLDLQKTQQEVWLKKEHWGVGDEIFPYLKKCRPLQLYYWDTEEKTFVELAYTDPKTDGLVKLTPTSSGPPNFHINGIQMLVQQSRGPYQDAAEKVKQIQPARKRILDTCGGMGYFAHFCLLEGAQEIISYEENEAVLWLRERNPWSPRPDPRLHLIHGDVLAYLESHPEASFEAILHDPPRFSIAGDLYSQECYQHFYRLLKKQGILFHYTGEPFKNSHQRNFPQEVKKRLQKVGFQVSEFGDGLLARKR